MVELKHQLVLDLNYQKFEKQRYPISEILNKNNYFFQVYELKQKFGYITINSSHKNEVVRKFSSCLIQKINGFFIVWIENKGEIRKKFLPIDIIYKLVKTTKKIDCNFSDQTNLAFPSTFSEGEGGEGLDMFQRGNATVVSITMVERISLIDISRFVLVNLE